MTAWLSFCGTLKTYLATGLTIVSAAAQETSGTWFSSQRSLIFMVSPLVEGPMMARTLSSSINCLANDTAFSGLPAVSLITNSSFRPLMPPAALIFSTIICTVFSSGAPRKDAGPVTEKRAPILTGSEGGGGGAAWGEEQGGERTDSGENKRDSFHISLSLVLSDPRQFSRATCPIKGDATKQRQTARNTAAVSTLGMLFVWECYCATPVGPVA